MNEVELRRIQSMIVVDTVRPAFEEDAPDASKVMKIRSSGNNVVCIFRSLQHSAKPRKAILLLPS
jgi:hypothetical protein